MAELYDWNKMKRIEQIEKIKENWKKETSENIGKVTPEIGVAENTWSVWRKKEPETEGFDTTISNLESPDDAVLEQDQSSGQK